MKTDINKLKEQVQKLFFIYHDPAHDEKHVLRVSAIAKKIALGEGYDPAEAEVAGLLHDIGRTIIGRKISHAEAGVPIAKKLLDRYTDFHQATKERILFAIKHHSDLETTGMLNNILQDADKLDGLGAIGINRAYKNHIPDYDPGNIVPKAATYGQFKNSHELIVFTTEWYNMLYTKTAKEIGKLRFEFSKRFMEEIKREIDESS